MTSTILLAGAGGAIGRRLAPLLLARGYRVAGTTRSLGRADELRDRGLEPIVVDVFDAESLAAAVLGVRPTVVIHQLTDLPHGLEPGRMAEAIARNARIRDGGTRNLVRAAVAAGTRRLVAQSIAWAYAPGPLPHAEADPLDVAAEGARAVSVGGVVALEGWTLNTPPLVGTVLRYGHIYGPGTGTEQADAPRLHVDAAAHAALLAIDGPPGIFNIAEPDSAIATEKARTVLGWDADFRVPT
jgi:nucleoside-diphosphate-sugar epimerase